MDSLDQLRERRIPWKKITENAKKLASTEMIRNEVPPFCLIVNHLLFPRKRVCSIRSTEGEETIIRPKDPSHYHVSGSNRPPLLGFFVS